MLRIGILIILTLLPLQLKAHSPLDFSIPKNGALIENAPNELVLSFKSPAKLIKVKVAEIQSTEKSSFLKKILGTKGNNEFILQQDISKELNLSHILTLPELPPGKFIITWRAMGEDGHILKGSISFEIQGN